MAVKCSLNNTVHITEGCGTQSQIYIARSKWLHKTQYSCKPLAIHWFGWMCGHSWWYVQQTKLVFPHSADCVIKIRDRAVGVFLSNLLLPLQGFSSIYMYYARQCHQHTNCHTLYRHFIDHSKNCHLISENVFKIIIIIIQNFKIMCLFLSVNSIVRHLAISRLGDD